MSCRKSTLMSSIIMWYKHQQKAQPYTLTTKNTNRRWKDHTHICAFMNCHIYKPAPTCTSCVFSPPFTYAWIHASLTVYVIRTVDALWWYQCEVMPVIRPVGETTQILLIVLSRQTQWISITPPTQWITQTVKTVCILCTRSITFIRF